MRVEYFGRFIYASMMLTTAGIQMAVAGPAEDMIGQQAVESIRKRYADTQMSCGSPNIPGPVCNGVIFRSTQPGTTYKFWEPSPGSLTKGAYSASYIRKDVKFKRMIADNNNGHIFYPPIGNPKDKKDVSMLCLFPIDGWTYIRDSQGCGVSGNTGAGSESCELQNITTGLQWFIKHRDSGYDNQKQCSFNIRDGRGASAVAAFTAFVDASNRNINQGFEQQNEIMLAISDPPALNNLAHWNAGEPATLPLQSLFYVPDNNSAQGLADAQYDQQDYCKATGIFLPIVTMELPDAKDQDFIFGYNPADQKACITTGVAGVYIEKGTWVLRPDPGTGKDEWTLEVTPTALGRNVRDDATTELVYAELVKLYGNDPQWKNNDGGGMRRQLVCHYLDARNKPTWNLEPFRPNVSNDVARRAGCNPV